jgi:hypothetical protein
MNKSSPTPTSMAIQKIALVPSGVSFQAIERVG